MMDSFKSRIRNKLKQINKKDGVVDWVSGILTSEIITKDVLQSQKAKAEGDKLFAEDNPDIERQHKTIRLYNESIAYAPLESEDLAKTYANKSALLRRMRRYDECISEIDNALKITKSIPLKIKLLCRKADCLTALGSAENRGCLEKAKFFMTRSEMTEEPDKIQKMLQKLIENTQKIIDEDKLDSRKEAKRLSQTSKLLAQAREADVWQNSVQIDYSEKYGLHVIAARDFEPGECILLEKPYHSYLQYSRTYQYCYHCLSYLWTIVPCDLCNWRAYCSEKYKKDSWDQYHDLECFTLTCVKKRIGTQSSSGFFAVSIFCKTLKEAGSIKQLLADVKSAEQKEGLCVDDFSLDKDSSYKNIYACPMKKNLTGKKIKEYSDVALGMLVALGTFSKIFDKSHSFWNMKKLSNDDVAISVGALLAKLNTMVMQNNSSLFKLVDPTELNYVFNEGEPPSLSGSDEFLSLSLCLLSSLTIRSCIPNCTIGATRENSRIWHSLQPIKKGDKLMPFCLVSSVYNYIPKPIRQSASQGRYNCSCDCRACIEDWSMVDLRKGMELVMRCDSIVTIPQIHDELVRECNFFVTGKTTNSPKYMNPDLKTLSRARDLLVRAWKHCEMPSTIISRAVRRFIEVSGYFYYHSIHDWK